MVHTKQTQMKQFNLLGLIFLLIISCKNQTVQKESKINSNSTTISDQIDTCFIDYIQYKFVNLDSISPDLISKYRNNIKPNNPVYDFYKLTKAQIKYLFKTEDLYSDMSYGVYVVSKQYEKNDIIGIIVFYWDDCIYYGDLLLIDKNCHIWDKFKVFSGLSCSNPGDSDDEKIPTDIAAYTYTTFADNGQFRTIDIIRRDYMLKADSSYFTDIDSTVYDCQISENRKIISVKHTFKYKE